MKEFVPAWRQHKSAAFHLADNSTARRTIPVDFWGKRRPVYANANLSIYSGQSCNANCPFCVEALRPASRGRQLATQKDLLAEDGRYFTALEAVLRQVATLRPSVSITGGEASLDPRLPALLRTLQRFAVRKPTLTTNGSGLLTVREGRRVVEWIAATGVRHLNVSRAHADDGCNARIMGFADAPDGRALREIIGAVCDAGVRPRLSCVLLKGAVGDFSGVLDYLQFARTLGVDNVIFRQLMTHDAATVLPGPVTTYCDQQRVAMDPLLESLERHGGFVFQQQVMGYYYYVEVWRWQGMDVVFESADLARLEWTKRTDAATIHELVFHPNGQLASTWQPWDGILGPPMAP